MNQKTKDFFDCITCQYDGADNYWRVFLDGHRVYMTKDSRDMDLFVAQLKGIVVWNDVMAGWPRFIKYLAENPLVYKEGFIPAHQALPIEGL